MSEWPNPWEVGVLFHLRPLRGPRRLLRPRDAWELTTSTHLNGGPRGQRYQEDPFLDVVLTVDGDEYELHDCRVTRILTPRGRLLYILEEQPQDVVGRERNASFIEAYTR
jgi:hypothetical protein